jgi:hypothetical protein
VKVTPSPEEVARLAELAKRRDDRMALREKRRAEREARRQARLAAQADAGGKKGGAPEASDYRTGKPDAVWMCNATDRGTELKVSKARNIHEWITIIPTVLGGFQTRPSLGRYVDDIAQVITRNRDVSPKRLGLVELSLPNEVLQIDLEAPSGVRLAVGRLDARCLVGFKYVARLFPFSIARAPVRIIDRQNNTVTALVDVTFYKDASIEITSADGTPLPFKRARLKNGNDIQRNIQDHYEVARLAKGVADVLGIKLGPRPRAPQVRPDAAQRALAAEKKMRKRAGAP